MTIAEAIEDWLEDSKKQIIANYHKDNMKASGNFERSLETSITQSGGSVKAQLTGTHYSLFVDQGRGKTTKSGSGTELRDAIEQWVKDKPIIPKDGISQDDLIFLITRKIHREGWKPKNQYPNGVISSVVNDASINKLLLSLQNITVNNITSELWQQFA
jgi:hypothetical protein